MPDSNPQLEDFLRHLHLGSEVYYVGQLCDAWHMSTPGGDATTFHLVCHGKAWVHMPNQAEPTQLIAGDIAFFPHDSPRTFSGTPTLPDQDFDYSNPAPLDKDSPGAGLLCGHLRLPTHIRNMLLASFPELMIVSPDKSPVGLKMLKLIEMMTEEAGHYDLGTTAVLDRLSDVLFFHIIRHALDLEPKLSPLLAILTDEHLRPAISAFIAHPAEKWTVERMASLAYQSRSTFSERFTRLVKISPMEFVTTWRMQLAVSWLAEGIANIMDVALRYGYESEAAFRKAFKRTIGTTPGKYRNRC